MAALTTMGRRTMRTLQFCIAPDVESTPARMLANWVCSKLEWNQLFVNHRLLIELLWTWPEVCRNQCEGNGDYPLVKALGCQAQVGYDQQLRS